jgi:hypothetical protein
MAKATDSYLPLTVEQAANAIIALINSSPQSPSHEEIAGIIGLMGAEPTKAAEWREGVARMQDSSISDEAYDLLSAALCKTSHEVWRKGAKSWADVALFAEMALYWNWDEHAGLRAEYLEALRRCDRGDITHMDEQSLAQLVRAVLSVEGRI